VACGATIGAAALGENTKPLRIALLPSAYAPAVGGVEELTRRLADQLIDRGHEVQVWTNRHPSTLAVVETICGTQVRRFEMPIPPARPAAIARAIPRASRGFRGMLTAARGFQPDLLHVQCFSTNGAYATALGRARGIPVVVTLQGETIMDDQDIYVHSLAMRTALRTGLRNAAAVTACSEFVLGDARERFGLSPRSGSVIYNGVDRVLADPTPLDIPFQRFVVAYGRIVDKKGFDLLIRAFARIAGTHPDIGLVIGGSGPALDSLKDLAAELKVAERVAFPGRLDRGQVASVLQQAEAFVLPSRVEPFGIVVLEAMAAHVPVLISSRGGAPEIVRHGREGLVADPFDTGAFADQLGTLVASSELRESLAAAAAVRVAEFTWQAITDRYDALYRELVG
jgi:glycogen(starch) synthase